MPKKNMTEEEKRKCFAPLQRYEDRQRAIWFNLGAGLVLIAWIISILIN